MIEWKALSVFGDSTLASAICHCLNFQQGLNKDENHRPKLVSPIDIAGKTTVKFVKIDVSHDNDIKDEYSYIFRH